MQEKKLRRTNRQRTEETRSALIAAARTSFVDKGYADTGTPEIVAAAGVTRGALYHHFADKQALFQAVVEDEAARVAAAIDRAVPADAEGAAALIAGGDGFLSAMAEPGRVRLLLVDGPAVLGPAAMAEIDARTGGQTLREGLAAALPPGRADEAALMALADLLSAAHDRAALAIVGGADPDSYRRALAALVRGVL